MILTEFLESGSLDHFLKVPYLHLVFCMLGYVSLAIDKNNELVLNLAWRGFKNILLLRTTTTTTTKNNYSNLIKRQKKNTDWMACSRNRSFCVLNTLR